MDTPPLASARNISRRRHYIATPPLLDHYFATTFYRPYEIFFLIYLKPYADSVPVMAETTELHARLMQDARNYDPAAHQRGLLAPYRDVLLVWRAKFMSYEQIAATLRSHGIRVPG